jgi:TonB family protein
MMIIAIAAIVLVVVGIVVALNLRKSPSKAAVPNAPVTTEQTVASEADSTAGAKPKPGAATTAATTTTTTPTAATTATDTTPQQDTTPAPAQSAAMQAQLNAASKITINKPTADKDAAPTAGFGSGGLDSMGGNSGASGVFNNGKGAPKVTAAAEAPKTLNVSGSVMAGRAISKTPPVYPRFARDARVDGTVVLHATISKAGAISNVSVISGPQMLRQAALDAVKTWRYKPYLLNNEPVEVETTVNVIFVLNG